eukprot:1754055-Alexandrium_andersonii.AAC.1
MPGHFAVRAPGGYLQVLLPVQRGRPARSGVHDTRRDNRHLARPDLAGELVTPEYHACVVQQ